MSDALALHDQLLEALDRPAWLGPPHTPHETRALVRTAALRAVVELHAPVRPFLNSPHLDCHGCGKAPMAKYRPPWPCPTIAAIASALGVEVPE